MCNNMSVNIIVKILPKCRSLQGNSPKIEHRWEMVTFVVRIEDVLDPSSTKKTYSMNIPIHNGLRNAQPIRTL